MSAAPASLLLVGEALIDALPGGEVVAGAPLNAARHLKALGCDPLLISRVGADADGRRIAAALVEAGLSTAGLQLDPACPTGRVEVRLQSDGGHVFRIAERSAWDHLDAAQALAALQGRQPRVIYYGTLAQRHPSARAATTALLAACAGSALRFLDLNLRDGAVAEGVLAAVGTADWLKVNEEELPRLLRWSGEPDVPALMRRFGLQRLIHTLGAAGYRSYDAGGQVDAEGQGLRIEAFVDSVGAGDAFCAGLLAAHLQGRDWRAGLALANRFAAAICAQAGGAPAAPQRFYPSWAAGVLELPCGVSNPLQRGLG